MVATSKIFAYCSLVNCGGVAVPVPVQEPSVDWDVTCWNSIRNSRSARVVDRSVHAFSLASCALRLFANTMPLFYQLLRNSSRTFFLLLRAKRFNRRHYKFFVSVELLCITTIRIA